jgi:hypothetical protein
VSGCMEYPCRKGQNVEGRTDNNGVTGTARMWAELQMGSNYDAEVARFLSLVVKPGAVCFEVGANMAFTLCNSLAGSGLVGG